MKNRISSMIKEFFLTKRSVWTHKMPKHLQDPHYTRMEHTLMTINLAEVSVLLTVNSGYTHSEDESARSPHGSPSHRASLESRSQDFSDIFNKSDADTDFQRSFDDQGWGNFDGTDDADSVWGFNSKEQHGDHLFDMSSFGSSPRTDSPQGYNNYSKRSPFNFADSVPGTPSFSKSGTLRDTARPGTVSLIITRGLIPLTWLKAANFLPHERHLQGLTLISSRSGFGGHS